MAPIIRFGEPIALPLPKEKLPAVDQLDNLYTGKDHLRDSSFQVYITSYVANQVWQHLNETPKLESGGVLIGHPFQCIDDPTITFVVIVDALRMDSGNRSIGHYTVGPAEIVDVRAIIERDYAGLKVVGWYHSHPGHGVFLSQQDMQIVQSIYNAEWHLAWVLDTFSRQNAFFFGPQGHRLAGWLTFKVLDGANGRQLPAIIRAINLYNRWLDARDLGSTDQAAERLKLKLQDLVLGSLELTHWCQKGYYQNIDCLVREPRSVNKNSMVEMTLPAHSQHDQHIEHCNTIFNEAQRLISEQNYDAAIHSLRLLKDKYPDFQKEQVHDLIALSTKKTN